MHAIVRVAGVQARVEAGDTIRLPKLDVEAGTSTTFEDVLLLSDDESVTVGTPTVEGASVEAEIIRHDRAAKIIVFKKKRRKRYRRTNGHRQDFTEVKVTDIVAPGAKKASKKSAPKKTEEPEAVTEPVEEQVAEVVEEAPATVEVAEAPAAEPIAEPEQNESEA